MTTTQTCNSDTHDNVYSAFLIYDAVGTPHPLSSSLRFDADGCIPVPTGATTTDGSGLSVATNGSTTPVTWTVYDKFGNGSTGGPVTFNVATPSGMSAAAAYSYTNYTTTYTDPLGTTGSQSYLVVTPDTSTPPNTLWYQYSYTDQSGNAQQYQVNYGSFVLATAFGCSNVSDIKGSPTTPITLPTSISLPGGGSYTFSYELPYGMASPYTTGRLTKITYPSGGYTTYAYSGTNGHGGTGGIDCQSGVVPTLTRVVNDNNGHSDQSKLLSSAASGSFGYPAPPVTVQQVDPSGNYTVYTMFGEYPTGIKYYQGAASGTPLKTVSYCYWTPWGTGNAGNCSSPSVGVVTPFVEIDKYTALGASSSSETKTTLDGYGNITGLYMYDYGATTPTQQTLITYGTWNGTACVALSGQAVSPHIVGTPCDIKDETGAGVLVGETRVTYDAYGRATDQYKWTGSAFLHSSSTYNSNGTIATSTDANGFAVSAYSYNGPGGCNSLLPTSVTVNSLTTWVQWNCNGAVATQTTDANGRPTNYTYNDPFWRITSMADPLGVVTNYMYPTLTTFETAMNFNGTVSTWDKLITTDGLGRQRFSQTRQGPGSTLFDTIQTTYGWSTSGPFSTTSMSYSGTQAQPAPSGTGSSTTQDDAVSRPTSISDTGGGVLNYIYNQNDDLAVLGPAPAGENAKQVQIEYDGLGRVRKVCHIGSTTSTGGGTACGQTTGLAIGATDAYTYTYASGSTAVSTARGSQTRSKTFDALGRVISSMTPEGLTTTYIYDTESSCGGNGAWTSNGDLLQTIDANGNHVCYYYDALHRLTDVGNNNQSTTNYCKRFRYDNSQGVLGAIPTGISVSNTLGRLVEAETDDCSAFPITQSSMITDEWFSYDNDGKVTDIWELTPHSTQYYHSIATFFGNGVVNTLQLASPSLYTITYGLVDCRKVTITSCYASKLVWRQTAKYL